MLEFKATIKGAKAATAAFKKKKNEGRRAMETALKRTGFLMRGDMATDLRRGVAGSTKMRDLRVISRQRKRPPLKAFARLVRYQAEYKPRLRVMVGFISEGRFALSARWLERLRRQFEGYQRKVTPETREIFAHWASQKPKRSKLRLFYYLRESTTRLEVPKRPFIDLYWKAEKPKTGRVLVQRYKAKMRGQRI